MAKVKQYPKKVVYEVRFSVGNGLSALADNTNTDKQRAIEAAKKSSKADNGLQYYVKKVSTEIVFAVGKPLK